MVMSDVFCDATSGVFFSCLGKKAPPAPYAVGKPVGKATPDFAQQQGFPPNIVAATKKGEQEKVRRIYKINSKQNRGAMVDHNGRRKLEGREKAFSKQGIKWGKKREDGEDVFPLLGI